MRIPQTMPTEEEEQIAVFRWAELIEHKHPELRLLYAVPNGGYRHPSTAHRMRLTGTKAGVPDMCLPVARGRFHGLYIELKRQKKGTVSAAQRIWLNALTEQGYKTVICWGADEAIQTIKAYLEEEKTT